MLARIVYNLMRYGMAYMKQMESAYAEQVRERLEKQLRRRALELGFELKKIETSVAASAEKRAVGSGWCASGTATEGRGREGTGRRSAEAVRAGGRTPGSGTTEPPRHPRRKFLGRRRRPPCKC
jgi:hypothetical protein